MDFDNEICGMKNKTTLTTAEKLMPLIIGCLLAAILFLVNHFKLLNLTLEVVLSPIVVISLLAYGESLLIYLFYLVFAPVSICVKIIKAINQLPKTVKQKLTFKQA